MRPPKFVKNWVLSDAENDLTQHLETTTIMDEIEDDISKPAERSTGLQAIIGQKAAQKEPHYIPFTAPATEKQPYKFQAIGVKGDKVIAVRTLSVTPLTIGMGDTPSSPAAYQDIRGTLIGEVDDYVLIKDEDGNPVTITRLNYDFYVKV